jgi:hypothetical protein
VEKTEEQKEHVKEQKWTISLGPAQKKRRKFDRGHGKGSSKVTAFPVTMSRTDKKNLEVDCERVLKKKVVKKWHQ